MRSTSDKLIHIPLTQGMNQSFNQWAAPIGTIVSCTNARIKAAGTVEKRPGTRAVVGTTSTNSVYSIMGDGTASWVESVCFLSEVGSALMLGTTIGEAFCLDSTLGTDLWNFQGRFSSCLPVRKRNGLVRDQADVDGYGVYASASAVNSDGYLMVAGVTASNQLTAVIDNQAGVRVWKFSTINVLKAQIVSVGAVFYLVYQVGTDIRAMSITPGSAKVTTVAPVSVGTLFGAAYNWDTSSDGTNWFLVHQNAAAALRVDRFTTTTSTHNAAMAMTAGNCPVSIWASSLKSQVWVGYYDDPTVTGSVGYAVFGSAALAVVLGNTTIVSAANVYGPPLFGSAHLLSGKSGFSTWAFYVFRYVNAGTNLTRATYHGLTSSAGAPSAPSVAWGIIPISKPDDFHRFWAITSNASTNNARQQVLLVRRSGSNGSDSPLIPELSSPSMESVSTTYDPSSSASYFHAISTGSTRSYFAFPFVLTSVSGVPIIKAEVYEYTTGEQERHHATLKIGRQCVVSGVPVEFYGHPAGELSTTASDGEPQPTGAAEIGFAQLPIITSAIDAGGVGGPGLAANGVVATVAAPLVYSYRVVFEWTDVYGRIHRSAPSAAMSHSMTSQQNVTISITTLDISQRQDASSLYTANAYIYRTVANGTTYNKLPSFVRALDATDGIVTFTDSYADTSISANAFIYTDGGVLQNDLAPSCRFLCRAENRVWFGGLWDATQVQCSKEIVTDEPLQCTDHDSHKVPLLSECTGLAYMDGSVVAFCETDIYIITGEGPNNQGIGAFPSPRILASGIGCVDYKSVLETSIGILFQSKLGLYLIPRGLGAPQYIGAAARLRMLSTPQVISAASCMSNGNHMARWVLGAANAQTGSSALSLDLNSNQWFQDTFASPMSEIGSSSAEGGFVLAKTSLSSVSVTYPVWIESSLYTDDESGSVYTGMALATSKIFPFGPGGWGKINKCVVAFEQTSVTCTARVYASVDGYSQQFADFSIASGSGIAYRGIDITNRYGTSITVQILDLAVGALLKPVSITLEIEPSNGVHQLTAAERA